MSLGEMIVHEKICGIHLQDGAMVAPVRVWKLQASRLEEEGSYPSCNDIKWSEWFSVLCIPNPEIK